MWTEQIREMILNGILETLYMTVVSTLFGYVFGLPMGVLLCISDKDGLKPHPVLYKILDFIANIVRSVPFLIHLPDFFLVRVTDRQQRSYRLL